MQLIQLLAAGLKDIDGTNLAAGKVLHYAAGTTTLKNMYTDYAGATPAAQPIILDSRGTAKVFGSGLYKLVITDADDAIVSTIDNFTVGGGAITPATVVVATSNGQAVFATPTYTPGTGGLHVYMNGTRLATGYTETSSSSITLGAELANIVLAGTEMMFEVF